MKKIKKLLKKLKNNAGSSIVMVIVSVTFIAIIVGALLSAAVLSYRLKLQDLNSRDNFYYVEQALNEVYTGVGTQTVKDLQTAYEYTVENMVSYDLVKGRYVTKSQKEAQADFTKKFYQELSNNDFFKSNNMTALYNKLAAFITNDTVVLDGSRLAVDVLKNKDGEQVGKIIRNVTLRRTQEYDRTSAKGTYTQSITTDIVVGDPDFSVSFDSINDQDPNIFKYALVADMGIYIDQKTTPLTIAGNVYAASDYYNKDYNRSTWDSSYKESDKNRYFEKGNQTYTVKINNQPVKDKDDNDINISNVYTHGSVTSKSAVLGVDGKTSPASTYYNMENLLTAVPDTQKEYYDGENIKSRYSGFYVNGSQVSVIADMVVVPGMLSVMDNGSLSVYGKAGVQTTTSEVWADGIVLDGYSTVKTSTGKDGVSKTTYKGSEAIFKANLFIKDDTEINAAGSTFQLGGRYFGYGDSTDKDSRKFTGLVDKKNFQVDVEDSKGNVVTQNRGHYNSSAIIVNGEQSVLNLSNTLDIFLAGRSYIELSKNVNKVSGEINETVVDPETNEEKTVKVDDTITSTYEYHPTDQDVNDPKKQTTLRDYKTGESLSIKSNQQAYIPVTFNGIPTYVQEGDYYEGQLSDGLAGSTMFEKYFPEIVFGKKKAGSSSVKVMVPCILQQVSGKKYYYYDFETAYYKLDAGYRAQVAANNLKQSVYDEWKTKFPSPEVYAAQFIADYSAELKLHHDFLIKKSNTDSTIAKYLVDIGDYEYFDAGNIELPNDKTSPNIYSSGAITSKMGTEFSIERKDDANTIKKLLTSETGLKSFVELDGTSYSAYQLSDKLDLEYDYVKWNLGHYSKITTGEQQAYDTAEKQYISDLVKNEEFGEAALTPINKFLVISKITDSVDIKPNLSGQSSTLDTKSTDNLLDLESGYSVWVSNNDVVVTAKTGDKGKVRGIVITKGNVYFKPNGDGAVTDFEGMIIAGGKVYVNGQVKTIVANSELCRTIFRECMMSSDKDAEVLLSLFRGYELDTDNSDPTPTDAKPIKMIDYTDVVSFSNWMKNVE